MKNKYLDLIEQTFDFPQEGFKVEDGRLIYREIDLMKIIEQYGTPLRFTYLPAIGQNIERCRNWFADSIKKENYQGAYNYCYCTKSSHFNFIIEECAKHQTIFESSSPFDIDIFMNMFKKGKLNKDNVILCNGYKTEEYIEKIKDLLALGFTRVIPIIDNFLEFDLLDEYIDQPLEIGIRIASEEDPKFEFYTSRMGIGYKDVVPFFNWKLKNHKKFKLSMLHFFVNTGISDNSFYWNELRKFLAVYENLIENDASIKYLNIGGGFPIKNSLGFDYDYTYMIDEIVHQMKTAADHVEADHPDIFTEFGSFTVAEAGGIIYTIIDQKKQNDRERWNMINSSFMTTLPDSWAINKRFLMLPINRWNDKYERVFLGGLTCDSDDYYNSEQHINAIYLPVYKKDKPLHVGFFNSGAYQESISGFGGIKHCLIPSPKHVLLDRDENGQLTSSVFAERQTSEQMLKILGYS